MAIYTNLDVVDSTVHGIAESSNLKATVVGNIYDVLVRDSEDEPIEFDNGVAVKVGEYTGNGLQERYATIAGAEDKIALVATPPLVKDAFTKAQGDETRFFHKAGKLGKAYEVVEDDIFGIGDFQITSGGDKIAKGNYVVVDGDGGWEVTDTEPDAAEVGFIGKIHSVHTGTFYNIVRVLTVQNKQIEE